MVRLFAAALLSFGVATAQKVPQVPGSVPLAPAPTMPEPLGDGGDMVLARRLTGETEIPQNPQHSYTDDAALQAISSLTGGDLGDP